MTSEDDSDTEWGTRQSRWWFFRRYYQRMTWLAIWSLIRVLQSASAGHPFPKHVTQVVDFFYIRGMRGWGKQHIADINRAAREELQVSNKAKCRSLWYLSGKAACRSPCWVVYRDSWIIVIPVVIAYHCSPRECVTVYCKPYTWFFIVRTGDNPQGGQCSLQMFNTGTKRNFTA